MTRLNFGGVLAFALLGLFLFALVESLLLASSCSTSSCPLDDYTALLLQTLGALVSAVVVSELAVTNPGEAPGTRIAADLSAAQGTAVKTLASVYIVAWLISGLFLVVVGSQHPTVPQVLSAGKEWLGFAIAAAYAYFGVSPDRGAGAAPKA
jgi:hypothetical protein